MAANCVAMRMDRDNVPQSQGVCRLFFKNHLGIWGTVLSLHVAMQEEGSHFNQSCIGVQQQVHSFRALESHVLLESSVDCFYILHCVEL